MLVSNASVESRDCDGQPRLSRRRSLLRAKRQKICVYASRMRSMCAAEKKDTRVCVRSARRALTCLCKQNEIHVGWLYICVYARVARFGSYRFLALAFATALLP